MSALGPFWPSCHYNTGADPLKTYKATKPAFNVGPSSARQRNAILMAFRWWANDCPLIVVCGSCLPRQLKKTKQQKICQIWTPFDKTFWISTWAALHKKVSMTRNATITHCRPTRGTGFSIFTSLPITYCSGN